VAGRLDLAHGLEMQGGPLRTPRHGPSASGRPLRILTLLTSLALLAVACGGGGSSDRSGAGEAGEPAPGGRMVIGLEAESDGWDPTKDNWAVSGDAVASAVYDPLMTEDEDGDVVPYLAESMEPNEDHTVWTMKLRSGVTFHDGTPLTSDAVKRQMDAHKASFLTGAALTMLESVEVVDELTLTFTMSGPWVSFPSYLTGQIGYVPAPAMLEDEDSSRHPIGTGPFEFEQWVPGQRWVGTKNTDYWRADEGLPYLDEIEFRPIVEEDSRRNALVAGDIDLLHTADTEQIATMRTMGDQIQLTEAAEGPAEENFVLLNTAVPPFDNVHARRALSLATDRDRYVEIMDRGITELANGPFSGQDEYPAPEGGYLRYDPDEAREELEAYAADTGEDSLSFEFATTNPARSLQEAQLFQDMWGEVGIDVSIRQVEQSQFIENALLGDYQAQAWRQHGASDPDEELVNWDIANALPVGEYALNYGRFADQELTDVLYAARATADEDERASMYGEVAQTFADEVPYVYTTRSIWAYAYGDDVGGVATGRPLPGGDGVEGLPDNGSIRPGALYFTG
jgi:peptide/nickel transport system substrate-binding protein